MPEWPVLFESYDDSRVTLRWPWSSPLASREFSDICCPELFRLLL